MKIREAILKAADSIESKPDQFNFMSLGVPDHCGTPGCALGWIGLYAEVRIDDIFKNRFCGGLQAVAKVMGVDEVEFYVRMNKINIYWSISAKNAAPVLRQYADHYHPITDHIPSSVREIFDVRVAA